MNLRMKKNVLSNSNAQNLKFSFRRYVKQFHLKFPVSNEMRASSKSPATALNWNVG